MKRVLIVSPHFAPLNAPDLHRVRMSLPYFREFGWHPIVLAVKPEAQTEPIDPSLMDFVPKDVEIHYTGALPLAVTRWCGVGNVGLRAFASLYSAGARLIRERQIDVVYFSTTMFVVTALGRLWKRRFGVPYVIDLQDPWYSTYYESKPRAERPPKYRAAQWMHQVAERWTMKGVDQLIAVSPAYLATLGERYPWLGQTPGTTIPFGGSQRDFDVALGRKAGGPVGRDPLRAVYIGAAGPIMSTAVRILMRALKLGKEQHPVFGDIRLEFVGTAYAPVNAARKSVAPIAREEGVGDQVEESTDRIAYRDALRALDAAGFLLLIGSDDPDYSPSKVYPYLLAGRPMVAVVHERSPVVDLLRRCQVNVLVTFGGRDDVDGPAARLALSWEKLLRALPDALPPNTQPLEPLMAPALTQAQCRVFEAAGRHRPVGSEVACPD